jgi:UDP-N-acetylglucosamine diphosphorylase/glucosamine-1-phosphate N-acetyltransferase
LSDHGVPSSSSSFSRIVVFDSQVRENFYPLSLTRPTFDFLCGTKSLLQNIEDSLESEVTDLLVPKYLEAICKEYHPRKKINESVSERCLVVNGLTKPSFSLLSEIKKALRDRKTDFVVTDRDGNSLFGVFDNLHPEDLSSVEKRRGVERKSIAGEQEGGNAIFRFPWEIVSENSEAIRKQAANFPKSEARQFELLGSKLHAASSAEIERYVTIDTRKGEVILDEGSKAESFSHITGPAYIGQHSIIKSAKIREGTSIGNVCRIGGEVEDSILFDYTNKNHDGFIGHSIIGSWVNLGALTTNSDLKNSYGQIKVEMNGKSANTGLVKVGCFIGDMTKASIGTLIMSGKKIGVSSQVFGTIVDDVPSFTLFANSLGTKSREIFLESAIETQRRMMERRSLKMTQTYVDLIKSVYNLTSKDRIAKQVSRGRFEFQ